jgi:hypothetical protein
MDIFSTKKYFSFTKKLEPVKHTFGCRSPNSRGEGMWDGAFIYVMDKYDNVYSVFYMDGCEAKSDSKIRPYPEVVQKYNNYLKDGWIPMTPSDISITTGFYINETTSLTAPPLRKRWFFL